MAVTTRDEDRAVGLAWHDNSGKAGAHVLVVGVSRYASKDVPYVASPARSARAIAEWFLAGPDKAGFQNGITPLASLAILLSEEDKGAKSQFLNATVPRALFDNVEAAIQAWRTRAETGAFAENNLLFLFVVSHGESFGRRTAFLLEDYNTRPGRLRFGMSEVEQLVEAVANLAPKAQLLAFDCCRLPTVQKPGFDKEWGTPLLDLPARQDPRQPMVLRSTALDQAAYGEDDGLTIFTDALLEALHGLAAEPAHNWVIDSYSLAKTIAKLVDLRRKDGEALQRPGSVLARSFPISKVRPTTTTTAFLTLDSDQEFAGTKFEIRNADNTVIDTVAGGADGKSFVRLTFADTTLHQIDAHDPLDAPIGRIELVPHPPVMFPEVPDRMTTVRNGTQRSSRTASDLSEVALSVLQPCTNLESSAVVTVVADRTDAGAAAEPVVEILPTDGKHQIIRLASGEYTLVVASSSGAMRTRRFTARRGATTNIDVVLPASKNEFMAMAIGAGVVPAAAARAAAESSKPAVGTTQSATAAANWADRQANFQPMSKDRVIGPRVVAVLGDLTDWLADSLELDRNAVDHRTANVVIGPSNSRYDLLVLNDERARPFRPLANAMEDRPLWLAAVGPDWQEIAWCPTIGLEGEFMLDKSGASDTWKAEFIVDARPEPGRSHLAAVVHSRQWTGLLAFLARRDFINGGAIVAAMLRDGDLQKTIESRSNKNPLAAVAGTLLAVGAGKLQDADGVPRWLRTLADEFPNIPDGPVLLARQLRLRGEPGDPGSIRALLLEAVRRGVPGFSLALDWLSEELAIHSADPACKAAAARVRRLALMSDPGRAFTVLRVG